MLNRMILSAYFALVCEWALLMFEALPLVYSLCGGSGLLAHGALLFF